MNVEQNHMQTDSFKLKFEAGKTVGQGTGCQASAGLILVLVKGYVAGTTMGTFQRQITLHCQGRRHRYKTLVGLLR